jgi:microcin C transport system permease protein
VGAAERPDWWGALPGEVSAAAEQALLDAETVPVSPIAYTDEEGAQWEIRITKETVQFPFRPVKGHPLGLDQSGRDVLTLILYATRISLLFGFLLVTSVLVVGTVLGGLQGYFGGWVDLFGQRVIEIYSAIPFLYAMIYLGSIYGRSFGLLLFVYACFNWIGISLYMRAEFLRLRRQPFTEAARSLGLPTGRIMWRHILPNALVPLITFFPFSLVGAIGSLSALDFLGFGLPVGTPSWGDLLSQAQTYPYAWWLILYPALALFVVILLTVFIGEGLRSAFDPKRETHWEA